MCYYNQRGGLLISGPRVRAPGSAPQNPLQTAGLQGVLWCLNFPALAATFSHGAVDCFGFAPPRHHGQVDPADRGNRKEDMIKQDNQVTAAALLRTPSFIKGRLLCQWNGRVQRGIEAGSIGEKGPAVQRKPRGQLFGRIAGDILENTVKVAQGVKAALGH